MKLWSVCRLKLTLVAFATCVLMGAGWARAQPANDSYANREVIASLPFLDVEPAIGQATVEGTDPQVFCRQAGIGTGGNTVWYSYTTGPTDEYLDFSTVNSNYDTLVAVYTGAPGAFDQVSGGCNGNTRAHIAGLRLRASTTYSIVIARTTLSTAAATLRLLVDVAPVFHVTKTSDSADGVCDADCSLREAISASNAFPGAVVVPAGTYLLTLPGGDDSNAGGDLDVRTGIGIYGAGVTNTVIDAGGLDRVMDVDPAVTGQVSAQLNGVTLTNGGTPAAGGGLNLAATLDFLTVEDVAITNNVAGTGGGLYLNSIARLRNVTLSGNQATTGQGGGAYLEGTRAVEMRDSTVSNNVSLSVGIAGGGIFSQAQLRLDQVTLSGNQANGAGGALFLRAGSLVMRNAALVDNVADADNNDTNLGGGLYLGGGAADIANSVIANNRALGGLPSDLNDCTRESGTLVSAYNHVRRPDNCFFEGPGDTTINDPLLGPLADNGGPTRTHAILAGSVLIDSADPTGCRDDNGLTIVYDQRGPAYPRTVGGRCDRGAYEYDASVPSPPNPPSNLVVIAVGDTSASLQWNDNSSNEDSFQIERAPAAAGPWTQRGFVGANVTTFTDTGLSPLTDYYYRVFARNAVGDSAPSVAALAHTTPVELQSFTIE